MFTLSWLHVSQEREIAKLEENIQLVREGNLAEQDETLDKLLVENSKLKFRLDILNRVSCTIILALFYT